MDLSQHTTISPRRGDGRWGLSAYVFNKSHGSSKHTLCKEQFNLSQTKLRNKDVKSLQDPKSGVQQGSLDVIRRIAHILLHAASQQVREYVEAVREC